MTEVPEIPGETLAHANTDQRSVTVSEKRNEVPGWEGSQGPFPRQYGQPHVYARDIHSGAGNCVCGGGLGDRRHVQAAPGIEIPARMRR